MGWAKNRRGELVYVRGIVVGSAHADRGTDSGRFPESARLQAQATIRAALRRRAESKREWDSMVQVDVVCDRCGARFPTIVTGEPFELRESKAGALARLNGWHVDGTELCPLCKPEAGCDE